MTIPSILLLLSAWAAFLHPGRALAQSSDDPQIWRVVVLRVDFPLEEPDELTTSGTGQFDLRSLTEALPDYESPYDTPPHDRAFYEAHLVALDRYYDTVSEGRVRVQAEVFPRAADGAYRLPASQQDSCDRSDSWGTVLWCFRRLNPSADSCHDMRLWRP